MPVHTRQPNAHFRRASCGCGLKLSSPPRTTSYAHICGPGRAGKRARLAAHAARPTLRRGRRRLGFGLQNPKWGRGQARWSLLSRRQPAAALAAPSPDRGPGTCQSARARREQRRPLHCRSAAGTRLRDVGGPQEHGTRLLRHAAQRAAARAVPACTPPACLGLPERKAVHGPAEGLPGRPAAPHSVGPWAWTRVRSPWAR